MECEKIHWVLCPACWGKTRTWIREDTVLENFPLLSVNRPSWWQPTVEK